jgi:hypothetical protein
MERLEMVVHDGRVSQRVLDQGPHQDPLGNSSSQDQELYGQSLLTSQYGNDRLLVPRYRISLNLSCLYHQDFTQLIVGSNTYVERTWTRSVRIPK